MAELLLRKITTSTFDLYPILAGILLPDGDHGSVEI